MYQIIDLKDENLHLVLKITSKCKEFCKEIKIMKRVTGKNLDRVSSPEVVDYGTATHQGNLLSLVILPRYGENVETFCQEYDFKISQNSIHDIG